MRRGLGPAVLLALALPALPAAACLVDPYSYSAYPESLALDPRVGLHVSRAWFDHPSDAYDHRILGRDREPDQLHVQFPPGSSHCGLTVEAGPGHVFEDLAPRLADLDGDGENEVVVVRTDVKRGAQLAVYGTAGEAFGLIAATAPIGAPHRWLAPAGIADFDGDGQVEIAYVDRPHVLGELVFLRLEGGKLRELARLGGVSNHRIGDGVISGGTRDCGTGPELVLASKDWQRLVLVRWAGGPVAGDGGAFSVQAMERAMACR